MPEQFKPRHINKIIVHCSATPEGRNNTIDDIRKWHIEGNKWNDVGYHYVIHLDGSIHQGRPDHVVGAHVSGHNANSIGVCYVGGVDKDGKPKDTRTDAQKKALLKLLNHLSFCYPVASIHGHNEFANKACPSFDVSEYRPLKPYHSNDPSDFGLSINLPMPNVEPPKDHVTIPQKPSLWQRFINWIKSLGGH